MPSVSYLHCEFVDRGYVRTAREKDLRLMTVIVLYDRDEIVGGDGLDAELVCACVVRGYRECLSHIEVSFHGCLTKCSTHVSGLQQRSGGRYYVSVAESRCLSTSLCSGETDESEGRDNCGAHDGREWNDSESFTVINITSFIPLLLTPAVDPRCGLIIPSTGIGIKPAIVQRHNLLLRPFPTALNNYGSEVFTAFASQATSF
jgi:hypothetical protein